MLWLFCWTGYSFLWIKPVQPEFRAAIASNPGVGGDEHIQVAIAIQVSNSHPGAVERGQPDLTVYKFTFTIVQTDAWPGLPAARKRVQIAVAIQITQLDGQAIEFAQTLSTVGEDSFAVVQPHFDRPGRHPCGMSWR